MHLPPPLRAAVVGAGLIGATHARSIRACGSKVEAVVVSSPDRVLAGLAAVGAAQGTARLADVLADPGIDVVHVCTPNATHVPIATAALRAGKHVVCEKPLALDGRAARALAVIGDFDGLIRTVPFVYRFHPMVRELRARIAAGELGAISVVHGSYLQDWLASPAAGNWRVDPAAGGPSRAFADIGSHWCDLFEFATGSRIASLSAQVSTVYPVRAGTPVSTEDAAAVAFRTDDGALGTLVVSQVAAGRKNRLHLEISGSSSSFAFDQEQPELLWAGGRAQNRFLLRDPGQLSEGAAAYAFLPAGHPQGYQDCFDAFVRDTYRAIAGETVDGLPTFADGARAAQLADAVLASAGAGAAWIPTPAKVLL